MVRRRSGIGVLVKYGLYTANPVMYLRLKNI